MLYIATVHFGTDKWIDVQLRYLKRNITIEIPFKIFMYVSNSAHMKNEKGIVSFCSEHLDQSLYKQHWTDRLLGALCDIAQHYHLPIENTYTSRYASKNHAKKLDLLAQAILKEASDSDYILFLDGDAFPIADLIPYMESKLMQCPLAAFSWRVPERGMPHPAFCFTTVGFWRRHALEWKLRPYAGQWAAKRKRHYEVDTGGSVGYKLKKSGINWAHIPYCATEKQRQRKTCPGLFTVLDNIVYHHGAGFRTRGILTKDDPQRPKDTIEHEQNISEYIFCKIASDEDFIRQAFIEESIMVPGLM